MAWRRHPTIEECSWRPRGGRCGNPVISIIVPCRNERAHIRTFLEGLLAQKTGGRAWQAWIADGMSDDGTREYIRISVAATVVST